MKVKTNRKRETKRNIDWHMYVCIELRSFSSFSMSVLFTRRCLVCQLSLPLSFSPYVLSFPITKRSEYTSMLANNPSQYNADDVASNKT